MNDQFISFETAILANKKGFREDTEMVYGGNTGIICKLSKGNMVCGYTLAPTQSLLQKWLREKHHIHIEIYANSSGWGWILTKLNGTTIKEITNDIFFYAYEIALEIGLQVALKLIKL